MAKINFKKGLTDIVLYIIIFIVVQISCDGREDQGQDVGI